MKQIFLSFASIAFLTGTALNANAEQHDSWALLEGPDGKTWSVNTSSTMVDLGNEWYHDLRYQTMTVTLFDASQQPKGEFVVDVTGSEANTVEVFGPVTQHLFNGDDYYEVGIEIHIPGNESNGYRGQEMVRTYSTNGQMLLEADGSGMILNDQDDPRFILRHEKENDLWGVTLLDIYKPAATGEGLELGHTFEVDNLLAEYMVGPILTTAVLSDGLHYIICHYEKPMVVLDENGEMLFDPETWMPYWTPDNHFVIENYDKDFVKVDELLASTACPDGIMLRQMGLGFMDEEVTEGYFTGDQRYNYLITSEDTNEYWSTQYAFEIFAQGNEHVTTLCDRVSGYWNKLSSIEGEEDQWVFLQMSPTSGTEQLTVVEAPSCQTIRVIPSEVDGKLISANIDRIADEAEGYKYVIGLNEPVLESTADVIAQYGIYHKDLTVDQYICFNMGPDAETFTPLVTAQSLDPHLFYADDKREFIFLSKLKGQDGEMHNTLFLGNEDGEILNVWTGDGTTKGDILQVTIIDYGTDQPKLFICYYDWDNDVYTKEFLDLPLDNTTAIRQLHDSATTATFYNLQGIAVGQQATGLMIRNGQKISIVR